MAVAASLLLTNLTEVDRTFYVSTFLFGFREKTALYEYGLNNTGNLITIPGQEGTTASWVRMHPFSLVTGAGSEAKKAISSDQLRAMSFTAQVAQWYKVVEISSLIWAQGRGGTMPEAVKLLGINAADSLEYGTASTISDTCIYPLSAVAWSETLGTWAAGGMAGQRIAASETGVTTTIKILSSLLSLETGELSEDTLKGGWFCVTKGRGYGCAGRITADSTATTSYHVLTVTPALAEALSSATADASYVTVMSPFCRGGTYGMATTTTAAKFTTGLLRKALVTLQINGAETFEDGLYRCIIHPDVEMQLSRDKTWANVMQYQKAELGERGEIGVWGGFKFIRSTMMPRYASTVRTANDFSYTTGPVRMTLCFGKGAWGKVTIGGSPAGGNEPQFIDHAPGTSGVYDPVDQFGTLGWKFWWKVKALNANNCVGIFTYLA